AITADAPLYRNWGLAIDIGTTTVVVALIGAGRMVSTLRRNPQSMMGADVISRIGHALDGSLALLCATIRTALCEMIAQLSAHRDILPTAIDHAVITGNTTMLYLLTAKLPTTLARAPFVADHLFGETVPAKTLGLNIADTATVYLPRCISAFVGADMVTALCAVGLNTLANTLPNTLPNRTPPNRTLLIVDVGTNGELILIHGEQMIATATAAGPAFEGASLSCGTVGVTGAIERVWPEDGRLSFSTIDNAPAIGICGSGIVDALATMREIGLIDETGYLDEPVLLSGDVGITLADIRAIQLAKGAIRAAIETLLETAGVSYDQIDALLIAGSFGSHLNLANAAAIGLFPPALLPVAQTTGNAAHNGAIMLLQDRRLIERTEASAQKAQTLALTNNPVFERKFIEYINF
ncbi:MAG: ASKHA domain-containing protein, partial [Lachnospiraceae bacterium]|nr:ASKHA domain-containing protein [Lachnospiraceae bacterium]